MRYARSPFVALFILALAGVACAPAQEQAETAAEEAATTETDVEAMGLEGAWRIAEFSVTSPDTSYTIRDPQPSLYLFLGSHYSQMSVPGDEPRELFSGDQPVLGSEEPTDAEKVTAFDSFIANSGSYELTDSTLTIRPMVARNPNFMAGGSLTFTYQIEGDELRLTLRLPWAPATEQSLTLTRLE